MSALTEPITGDGGAIYHPDTDDEQTGDGTIATTGTAVTGTTTTFLVKMPNLTSQPTFMIASLSDGSVEARLVTAIATETACTLGTAFSEDLAALTTWTFTEGNKIPFVTNASGGGGTRNAVDSSHLGTGTYDTSIPGSITPNPVSFPIHFVGANAEHQELAARAKSGLTLPYIIFRKDATTAVAVPSLNNGRSYFRGWIAEHPYTQDRNATNKINYTLNVVGETVYEAGT